MNIIYRLMLTKQIFPLIFEQCSSPQIFTFLTFDLLIPSDPFSQSYPSSMLMYILVTYHTLAHPFKIHTTCTGYDDCTCEVNPLDIEFCGQYISSKPEPTVPQFSQLAKIIIEEDHLSMPTTVMEGLKLYLTLVDKITQLC